MPMQYILILMLTYGLSFSNTINITEAEVAAHQIPVLELEVALAPALVPICACESSYEGTKEGNPQQFEPDGKTVRYGRENSSDRGMCQINRRYWGEQSKELGFDIETEQGNIKMANWIYEHEGTKPWGWSKSCHGK